MTASVRLEGTPVLVTDRLVLRAPCLPDFDAYAGFMAAPRAHLVGGPMTRAQAWRYFGHHVGHWALRGYGTFFMALKIGGPALGMIMAWQPEGYPEREVGWGLFTAADDRRGYATEGARAVLSHVFRDLGWDTAVSYIAPENAASVRLAERLGAVHDPEARQADSQDPDLVWRHRREVWL